MANDDVDQSGRIHFRDGWLEHGFTQVPNCVLHHPTLSPGAKVVYALLLSFAWREDHCWPGQRRLAEAAASSERSVRNWLAELRDAKVLTIERRGLTQTNVYWLERLDHLAEPARAERQDMPIRMAPGARLDRNDVPPKNTQGKRRIEGEIDAPTKPDDPLAVVWATALADLAEQTPPGNYARWLSRVTLAAAANGTAVVACPDRVTAEQLRRRYDALIRQAVSDALGRPVSVEYRADGDR